MTAHRQIARCAGRALAVLLTAAASAAAPEPERTWTLRDGRRFDAPLGAVDGLRAGFAPVGQAPFFIPLADFSPGDAGALREWRADWRRPLVLPGRVAPWPAQAAAPAVEVRVTGAGDGTFTCESENFRITSEVKLTPAIANDLARIFEATRAALIAMPLGLHAGGEREKYTVSLLRDAAGYADAGGAAGSGGYYDARTRRMLVLLPNLGIRGDRPVVQADYARSIFVLKHEVTHQLMARWHGRLPMWAGEGLAEFTASLPYTQGRYTLQKPAAGMREYLLKWRATRDTRAITLIPPAQLMGMDAHAWREAVGRQQAYDLYNSAALLTLHFIIEDGGAPLAGWLDALRRGENAGAAEKTHLLRGGTREALEAKVTALARKLGIEVRP